MSAGLYNKAKFDLGFNPSTSLKDGLLNTVKYLTSQRSQYQNNVANKYFEQITKSKTRKKFKI